MSKSIRAAFIDCQYNNILPSQFFTASNYVMKHRKGDITIMPLTKKNMNPAA